MSAERVIELLRTLDAEGLERVAREVARLGGGTLLVGKTREAVTERLRVGQEVLDQLRGGVIYYGRPHFVREVTALGGIHLVKFDVRSDYLAYAKAGWRVVAACGRQRVDASARIVDLRQEDLCVHCQSSSVWRNLNREQVEEGKLRPANGRMMEELQAAGISPAGEAL